ncbi:MAG: ATP-binding protein [Anaerolineales bacterium]|nr:ATP-binding protein [Anaerolineales bacterium]
MLSNELLQLLKPPMALEDLGVSNRLVSDIAFRILFNEGDASVVRVSEVLGIHARIIDQLLSRMKQEHLVEVTKAGSLGSLSFTYSLTQAGMERARDAFERSQYVGRLPVTIDDYTNAILIQAKTKIRVRPDQVKAALNSLILPENFHRKIGPAVNAGTSLFLYGPPGNGKTTIAEAIGKLLSAGEPIWLPDALTAGGQIIRLFDPLVHIPIKEDDISMHTGMVGNTDKLKVDRRWRLFERPVVMVGGELTMDSLDLRYEPIAKVYEAPLQLKANGGMFLIDDFGRQQISPQQLLNRWIVPLESNIDFLRLQSGQSIEVPFRQLIVFSTNLDPGDLVDGAFLRRIQMKVEVGGPEERLFYQIFTLSCRAYNLPFDKNSFLHLLQKWYREPSRTMQAVHPRDIVKTVVSICDYENMQPRLTPELIDEACESYFVETLKDSGKTLANM